MNVARQRVPVRHIVLATLGILVLSACDDTTEPEERIIEGIDFSVLFAEPSQAEINAISADWAGRDVSAQGVTEEAVAHRM